MTDDDKAIEEANAGFYRAFEALDLRAMEDVWSHDEHVQCVHPGWPLLTGWGPCARRGRRSSPTRRR